MTAHVLLTALELAGVTLAAADDGRLLVSPGALLSDDDRADLARLKPELVALLNRREADRVCADIPLPPPVPKPETLRRTA